jgi:hypothetical protein
VVEGKRGGGVEGWRGGWGAAVERWMGWRGRWGGRGGGLLIESQICHCSSTTIILSPRRH